MYCYDNYQLDKKRNTLFIFSLIALITGMGFVFYRTLYAAFIIPLIYKRSKCAYENYLVDRRKRRLLIEFKDFLYLISSSLATGRHMTTSMGEAKDGLREIYDDSLMAEEIEYMMRLVDETGNSEEDVITEFAKRTGLEDIEDFAQVYRCCRQTGGNMIMAVNKAADVIGDKITIEREIQTIASQKKLEGRIITSMPIVMVLFLQILSPEYLDIMYETLAGRIIMTLVLATTIGAYVAIERIISIEI